nr:PAS domain-containing sensor histidine kinase [Halomicroarcula sp. SYNS111]
MARRTALDALTDTVLILDDQDRVVDCNPAARALFDITGGVTGVPVTAVLEPVDGDVRPALTAADGRETEAAVRTDGEQRHLLCSSSHIGDDGRRGRVVICYDVTERREREAELERTNEQLDQFASVVSHDLRNPLTVAIGRLEMARAEHDSDHLAAVAAAHERMETLIADVLTLAREGKSVSEMRPVSLATLAAECWGDVETKGARVVTETDRVVRADRSRLQQLLENLLRNAVEHGGEDVTVTIGDLPDGFYVADDGPGIPTAAREQVFAAGYSTTDAGTGLGLNIAQQIAHAHDWEIRVTESDGGGARFELTGVEFVR